MVSSVVDLAPSYDLAVRQDGVLGGVVGQHRVAPGAAVDEVVLGFSALPRVYQVSAPADQLVGAAKAPERVVLRGTYQLVRSRVAGLRHRQGYAGERHHHKPHDR